MGEAGANMAHWAGLYGEADGQQAASFTTAAAATATAAAVSSPTSGGSGGGSPARRPGGVESGRVGKPARRRSRASRRAPVTLLNTDTSNFRAMVQQFTGVPAGPYGPGAGGPVISFGEYGGGGGAVPVRPAPTSALNMSFDHLQHRPPVSLQGQLFRPQQQHHHHQQQYGGDGGYGGGGGDMSAFLHGLEASSSVEDRMLLQSMHAAQMMPRPASANNSNGYSFG